MTTSGTCGDNLTWVRDGDESLIISGAGAMYDYYPSDNPVPWGDTWYLKSISLPEGLTHIGNYAFATCGNIKSLIIPSTVVSIGNSAFENCTKCEGTLEIPLSVTTIGRSAFNNDYSLTSLKVGASVTSIGIGAFTGCYGLTEITFLGSTPPTLGTACFGIGSSSHPVSATVKSPGNMMDGVLDSYKNAYTTFNYTIYITPAKRLTYSNAPIQVESAIRDGTGQIIKDKCARHATFPIDTDEPDSDDPPTWEILVSSLGLRPGELPRIVQIFDASGHEIGAEINISATQITVNLIDAPADEIWTAQITAW